MLFFVFLCGTLPVIEGAPSSVELKTLAPPKPYNGSIKFKIVSSRLIELYRNMATHFSSPLNDTDYFRYSRHKTVGEVATRGLFTSVVFITGRRKTCTGVLLKPSVVLTSASCIGYPQKYPRQYYVYAGDAKLEVNKDSRNVQKRRGKEIHYYHKYQKNTKGGLISYLYNLAVLKVAKPFQLSGFIKPIEIAKKSPVGQENCIVAGFRKVAMGCKRKASGVQCKRMEFHLRYWSIECVFSCEDIRYKRLQEDYRNEDHSCSYTGSDMKAVKLHEIGGPMICNGELFGVGSWTKWFSRRDGGLFISTTPRGAALDWINALRKY